MIPTFAQGGAPMSAPDQGLDLDAQVQSGLEAFAQSQDPAIAVEICNMLIQMYGIAPEVDPYAGMDAQMGMPQEQMPMAKAGMRIYKNGGKIRKYAPGGPIDPPVRRITSQLAPGRTASSEYFVAQDRSSNDKVASRYTTPGLVKSLGEKKGKGMKRKAIQDAGLSGGDIAQAGGYRIGNAVAYDYGNRRAELAGSYNQLQFQVDPFEHTLEIPALEIVPRATLNVPGGDPSVDPTAGRPGKTMEEIRSQNSRKRYGKEDAVPVPWVRGQKSGPDGFRATKNYRYKDRFKKNLNR